MKNFRAINYFTNGYNMVNGYYLIGKWKNNVSGRSRQK